MCIRDSTNADAFAIVQRAVDQQVSAGDPLLILEPVAAPKTSSEKPAGLAAISRDVKLPLVHGIHARPAARIGKCAGGFKAEIHLVKGDKRASARSPISLLALGSRLGDTITLEARGDDAVAALLALGDLIESGMGELADSCLLYTSRCV